MKLLLLSHHAISCWGGLRAFFLLCASDEPLHLGNLLVMLFWKQHVLPRIKYPQIVLLINLSTKKRVQYLKYLKYLNIWVWGILDVLDVGIASGWFLPVFSGSTEDDLKRRENPTGWQGALLARLTDIHSSASLAFFPPFRFHIGVHSLEEWELSLNLLQSYPPIPKQRHDMKWWREEVSVILLPHNFLGILLFVHALDLFSRIRHSQSLPSSGAKAQQKTRRGCRGFIAEAEKHLRPAAADTDQGKDWRQGCFEIL